MACFAQAKDAMVACFDGGMNIPMQHDILEYLSNPISNNAMEVEDLSWWGKGSASPITDLGNDNHEWLGDPMVVCNVSQPS